MPHFFPNSPVSSLSSRKNFWLKMKATPLISSTLASAVVFLLTKLAVMAMANFPRNSLRPKPAERGRKTVAMSHAEGMVKNGISGYSYTVKQTLTATVGLHIREFPSSHGHTNDSGVDLSRRRMFTISVISYFTCQQTYAYTTHTHTHFTQINTKHT